MTTPDKRYDPEKQYVLIKEFWDDLADEATELRNNYDLTLLPWMALALLGQIAVQTQPPEPDE